MNSCGPGRDCNCKVVYCFLSVLSAHINFPACSKTPPTQLHYHSYWVTILIRLTYASIFSRVAFLLGMLGHWRWGSKLFKYVTYPPTQHYVPVDSDLWKQRLLQGTRILELWAGVPYTIWLPSTWYIQSVIYCRGHQCQSENPNTSWVVRDRPLSKTHPLTEQQKCDLGTMPLIGYKPATPKSV